MGRASNSKQGEDGRQAKVAAQREAKRQAERRNRLLIGGGAIIVVLAILGIFLVINALKKPSSSTVAVPTGAALAPIVAKVTSVPAATLDQVGAGNVSASPPLTRVSGAGLSQGGKPEVLYMGAEYCPYCAAERWSMIVALSRFGTFTGLSATHSASRNGAGDSEPYPNTPTFTFHGSSYASDYLTFTPVEMQTNIPDASTGGYTALQTPTKEQQTLLSKYDAPPYVASADAGAIPFVDFANQHIIVGASYDPGTLTGLNWTQISDDLSNASSPVAKAVGGAANYITAGLCELTGNKPATACTPAITSLQSHF
jgi:Domain of unknown function (DUF929)